MKRPTLIIAILAAVALAIVFAASPYLIDDYSYMKWLNITEDGMSLSWHSIRGNFLWRYAHDNVRLANIAVAFAFALPKWINGLILGSSLVAAVWILCRLICRKPIRWGTLAATLVLTLFFLPLGNVSFAMDFQYNYLGSSLILSLVFLLFFRNSFPIWLGVIAGIVIGWWHEGFAAPALAGLGVVFLKNPEYRENNRFWMLATMFLTLVAMAFVPGAADRISYQTPLKQESHFYKCLFSLFGSIIFIAMSIVAICRKKKLWHNPVWTAFMATVLAGAVLRMLCNDPRSAWAAELVSSCGIVMFLPKTTFFIGRVNVNKTVAAALALLLFVHLAVADVYAVRNHNDFNKMIEHEKNGDMFAVLDILSGEDFPLIVWNTADSPYRWQGHARYYDIADSVVHGMSICPPDLLDFTPASAVDTLQCGWYRSPRGRLVAEHTDSTMHARYDYPIIKGRFYDEELMVRVFPFVSRADGRAYDYILPVRMYPWQRKVLDAR